MTQQVTHSFLEQGQNICPTPQGPAIHAVELFGVGDAADETEGCRGGSMRDAEVAALLSQGFPSLPDLGHLQAGNSKPAGCLSCWIVCILSRAIAPLQKVVGGGKGRQACKLASKAWCEVYGDIY